MCSACSRSVRPWGGYGFAFLARSRGNRLAPGALGAPESRVLADVAPHGPCIGSVGLIPDPHRSNADCLMLGVRLGETGVGGAVT